MIDNKKVDIRYDFRSCLKIILAYEENGLSLIEKQSILMAWFYPEIPNNREEGFRQAIRFLNNSQDKDVEEEEEAPNYRIFSFQKDSALIYAAFQQTHHIDLTTVELHWHQFLALFNDLGSETTFAQIRNLRYRLKTGQATKEERHVAAQIADLLELPELDRRTYEEKLREKKFMERLKRV